jgi:hypothetical protein
VTTDTIIQNYLFHHYYNYVYMNKTIRFKKRLRKSMNGCCGCPLGDCPPTDHMRKAGKG